MSGTSSQGPHRPQKLLPVDLACIRALAMFDGIESAAIDALVEHATAETHATEATLFSAGDEADGFYAVVTGRARLYALTSEGRLTTITFIEPGMSFAEGAIFGMRHFPLHADVTAGTRVVHVPRDRFLERLAASPELPEKMLAALARWQRRLVDAVTELKTRSPSQRFAAVLLSMTDRQTGPADVPLQISKAALANRIGIVPESMSRVFVRMRDLGVVVDGGVIRIRDVSALRAHLAAS